jgi:hypothetical protein
MSLKYKIDEHAEYIECVVSGSYQDATDLNEQLASLSSQCRVNGCIGLLCDLRNMTGYPNATDRILIFEGIVNLNQKAVKSGKPSVKVVFLKDEALSERLNLSLNTDQAGKLCVATSADPDQAVAWLVNRQLERRAAFSMDLMEFVHLRYHRGFRQSDSHFHSGVH